MKIVQTDLPGVLVLEPRVFHDDRGFFYELYNAERFDAHRADGLPMMFRQDNHSPYFAPVPEPSTTTGVRAMTAAVLSALGAKS